MQTCALVPVCPFPWLKNNTKLELSNEQRHWLATGLFKRTVRLLLSMRAIRDVIAIGWETSSRPRLGRSAHGRHKGVRVSI